MQHQRPMCRSLERYLMINESGRIVGQALALFTSPDPQRKSDQDHRIKLVSSRARERERTSVCLGELGHMQAEDGELRTCSSQTYMLTSLFILN